jgi:hypothetical protein
MLKKALCRKRTTESSIKAQFYSIQLFLVSDSLNTCN